MTKNLTVAAIDSLTGPELLAAYNARAEKPVKRFATKAAGRKRLAALLAKEEAAPKPKKEKKARVYAYPAKAESLRKLPREGSKRRAIFDLFSRPEGGTIDEATEATGWDVKTARAAIHHLNYSNGFSLTGEIDGRIRVGA